MRIVQQLLSWCLPGRLYGNFFKQPFIIVYRDVFDLSVVINRSSVGNFYIKRNNLSNIELNYAHAVALNIKGSHAQNVAIKREAIYGG